MGKKRKKTGPRPRPKSGSTFKQQVDATAAKNGLTRLPTMALVATIDTMIGILQERGYQIRDWDDKGKVVQKMKCIGNKVYILAPHEQPESEAGHGESGKHKPSE